MIFPNSFILRILLEDVSCVFQSKTSIYNYREGVTITNQRCSKVPPLTDFVPHFQAVNQLVELRLMNIHLQSSLTSLKNLIDILKGTCDMFSWHKSKNILRKKFHSIFSKSMFLITISFTTRKAWYEDAFWPNW